jgi:dipeptidase D
MPKNAIEGIEPKILWERFYEITQVPRPSKKEEKIIEHFKNLLNQLKVDYKVDKLGNIVAFVPATKGYENTPTVVLQGHMDMVCEKNKDKVFDFDNDPIDLFKEDGWITADGTTLGADNGIGLAAALAVITDTDIIHGPIEILCTVDEETGLTGANNLEPGFITGKIMLNMDSEEDGAFYVGCAGGIDTVATMKIESEPAPKETTAYELLVTGLKGGHSGLDIQAGRGNAIKILARALNRLNEVGYSLASLDGGSLRNAIPREAEAIIFLTTDGAAKAEKLIKELQEKVIIEFKTPDGGVKIELKKSGSTTNVVYTNALKDRIVDTLLALPHGVIAMSPDLEGLVETSTNLATVKVIDNNVRIGTSQRSSIESAKDFISDNVAAIFRLAGSDVKAGDGYPGWKPNMDSEILKISKTAFRNLFNKEAEIKAIHAGLECGILEGKNPGLDMISFGPTIQGAHSPDEKLNIETVEKFYLLLKGILKEVAGMK